MIITRSLNTVKQKSTVNNCWHYRHSNNVNGNVDCHYNGNANNGYCPNAFTHDGILIGYWLADALRIII